MSIKLKDYPIQKEIFDIFNKYALLMFNSDSQQAVWIGGSLSLKLNGIDLGREPHDIDILFDPDHINLFTFIEGHKDFKILEKKKLYVRDGLWVYKCLYKNEYHVDVMSSNNRAIYNYENKIGVESIQNVISAKQELITTYYGNPDLYITKKKELIKHCRDVGLIHRMCMLFNEMDLSQILSTDEDY